MLKQYYTGEPQNSRSAEPKILPKSNRKKRDDPAGYRADPGLVEAANVALILGKPLLLTGDPGVGKTSFATSLASELGLGEPLRFETKSTSVSRDLFYVFDTLGRFKSEESGLSNLDFISWQALGEAIIRSNPPDKVANYLNDTSRHHAPRRSVVLIDEIDKAPRDFPNDLLNEIERGFFRVPEMGNEPINANDELMPVLILTSNSETNLPDAFLRRCIYYHIPFPERDKLRDIIAARTGIIESNENILLQEALSLFDKLRDPSVALTKPPSIAELIEWLYTLTTAGVREGSSLRSPEHSQKVTATLSILAKTREDRERAQSLINDWLTTSQQ